MGNYEANSYYTTDLVLNVMSFAARNLGVDINDNEVADQAYEVCARLEEWDEGDGFGSSDHWPFVDGLAEALGIEISAA